MHPLAARALGTIRRHDLIPRGARVAIAVSGGPDSVAMLFLLRELEHAGELACAGVIHVNHQLRPETAARDETYVRELAARLRLPIEVARVDTRELARKHRTSIENAARIGRYPALRDAMTRLDAVRVAVGHTRDDQAETFLLRIIRGAGTRGRRAIHPRRGPFVRPLLDISRDDLLHYLRERGITFCHDETNDDVAFMRNRVRHELLPLLRERFSPSITRVLARNAELASADEAYLSARAEELSADIVTVDRTGTRAVIDGADLAAAPPALAWRVALQTARAVTGMAVAAAAGFDQARAIVRLASGSGPCRVDLAGVRAERIGGQVVLSKRAGRRSGEGRNPFRYTLSIPGEAWVREADCTVTAEPSTARAARSLFGRGTHDSSVAVVAAEAVSGGLSVRNRRPGDAFRPLGLGGRKKLQDFFVDRKVARPSRDRVPLVVDDRDRIVWVAGHGISEEFRVPDAAQAVVILRLKTAPQPGSGRGGDGDEEQA